MDGQEAGGSRFGLKSNAPGIVVSGEGIVWNETVLVRRKEQGDLVLRRSPLRWLVPLILVVSLSSSPLALRSHATSMVISSVPVDDPGPQMSV